MGLRQLASRFGYVANGGKGYPCSGREVGQALRLEIGAFSPPFRRIPKLALDKGGGKEGAGNSPRKVYQPSEPGVPPDPR